jgi:hypothetical protein
VPPELEGTMFMFNIILLAIVIAMASILMAYWFVTRRYAARQETKSVKNIPGKQVVIAQKPSPKETTPTLPKPKEKSTLDLLEEVTKHE